MLERRVEVLFSVADYERLRQFAHEHGATVGEAVREAVARYVAQPDDNARQRGLARLLSGEFDMDWPSWDVLEEELSRALERDLEAR